MNAIRRHPQVVSVSGDAKHWSGPSEMSVMYASRLPKCFNGVVKNIPKTKNFPSAQEIGWGYATDEQLAIHQRRENQATADDSEKFRTSFRG